MRPVRSTRRFAGAALLLLAALSAAACETRDVSKDLEIVEVRTGWYNAGPVQGMNKIVPGLTIQLKNVSDRPISRVQIDAVFLHVDDEVVIDEHYVPGIASNQNLEPGDSTPPIVLRSEWGFTGQETLEQMLENSNFRDARVRILGRHGRSNWIRMREIPIERRIAAE